MGTNTRYDEGDVVVTNLGRGVVAAVLSDDFEFPVGEEGLTDVQASDDRPAYVVALEATGDEAGAAVYRASALEASSFDDDQTQRDGDVPVTDVVSEDVDGLEDLPEGWNRRSVLEYWASIGGSWEECTEDMADELGDERAREHCSAMKDEVLQTTRWRNRF